jgi:hypothetical protein
LRIRLELGEDAQHIEECLTGSGRGVDRLFGRLQRDTATLEFMDDILKIADRTCETVNPGNDERITASWRGGKCW